MIERIRNCGVSGAESALKRLCGDDCTINIRQHRFISLVNGRLTSNESWRINVETYDRIEVDSGPHNRLDRCVHVIMRSITKERVARATSRRRLGHVATDRR